MVDNVVYEPFGMTNDLAGTTLASPRQEWAAQIDLVFASSLLTEQVFTNQDADHYFHRKFEQDYQLSPTDGSAVVANFTPFLFASTPQGGASLLLPAGAQAGQWSDQYESGLQQPGTLPATYPRDVRVIDTAAASSAAGGAAASQAAMAELSKLLVKGDLPYYAADLAPPVELQGGDSAAPIPFPGTIADHSGSESPPTDYANLAARQVVRTADGGYLDNTSVAYLLRHLQDSKKLADGASLVLFMNSTSCGVPAGSQTVPESVAVLFGYDPGTGLYSPPAPGKQISFCDDGFCIPTFSPQVFDPAPWQQAQPSWWYTQGTVHLRYFSLEVQTVGNSIFGVSEGTSLNLHLFINENFFSGPLPASPEVLDSYTQVFDATRAGVAGNGGAPHLLSAFGLD